MLFRQCGGGSDFDHHSCGACESQRPVGFVTVFHYSACNRGACRAARNAHHHNGLRKQSIIKETYVSIHTHAHVHT